MIPTWYQKQSHLIQHHDFLRHSCHILNFGHTLGHVFEGQLKIPHGKAVLLGLDFSLHWSLQRKILSSANMHSLVQAPILRSVLEKDAVFTSLRKLKNPAQALKADKKRSGQGKIRFIFLAGAGKPRIEEVSIPEVLQEMKRQS